MATTMALIPLESLQLMDEALSYCKSVTEVTVLSDEQQERAVKTVSELNAWSRRIEDDRKNLVKPLNDQVKAINDHFKEITQPLSNLVNQIRTGMANYYDTKERKRRQMQAELEAKASAERKAAEDKAQAARDKAQALNDAGKEKQAAIQEAKAETILQQAATAITPVLEKTKVEGASFRTEYKCEVTDMKAAAAACLKDTILSDAVFIDLRMIDKIANGLKRTPAIDGLRWVTKTIPVVRK